MIETAIETAMIETSMIETAILVSRPQRWDSPFDPEMDDFSVERLLNMEPFCQMDASEFPANLPLHDILKNDTRILNATNGDLIVREGDYGNSAFLILNGQVRVALQALSPEILGRSTPQRPDWWKTLSQMWSNPQRAEVRRSPETSPPEAPQAAEQNSLGTRTDNDTTRVFLQDVPGVLSETHTAKLGSGEVFGELAALSRTPRTATVFSEGNARLLEIRWQGLRDLMRWDSALRNHIDRLYRENSLLVHLRETPLLKELPAEAIHQVASSARFQSFGNFDWHTDFGSFADRDQAQQFAAEPLIVQEETSCDALYLIRSGFARLSQQYGNGHRTIAYLGKGKMFGMAELNAAFQSGHDVPLRHSLRAVGYVDVLKIPRKVVLDTILPHVSPDLIPQFDPYPTSSDPEKHSTSPPTPGAPPIDPRTLDFLVDHRLVNGTQTMLIDLDRCTRCDDCVRACAATHDNNPRFVRQGPKHDHLMIANACMHCVDPVCMIGCPTGAIARDSTAGTVCINDNTCIGCTTCAQSCPYDAIRMVEIRDNNGAFYMDAASQLPVMRATKCDLCQGAGIDPACQTACPHDALIRTDMGDLPRLVSWLGR